MNSLASTQRVRRVVIVLSAITLIVFAGGCGSSGTPPVPNQNGFSNSSLSGTYVFSSQGADAINGFPLAVAGTLVSNGTGGITGGTMDIVTPSFLPTPPSPAAQTITSGSYSVSSDGRGRATLSSAYGSYTMAFVLTSTSHGLVSEFDGNGGGSGTIDIQTTAITSVGQLAGPYAFSAAGADSGGGAFATEGAFVLTASGSSSAGVQDFNDDANPITNLPLAAVATVGSGTGPGTLTLSTGSFVLTFDYYATDATHLKLIETDYNQFLAGDVFTQTGASAPTGILAFTMSGGVNFAISNGGFVTFNGATVTGSEDVNSNGTILSQTFGGNAGAAGAVGSRVVVNLSGFNPATQWVIYPSSGGFLLLETDTANMTSGTAYTQQSGAALAPSQPYGFSLSAFNITGPNDEDDIAQFTTTTTGFSGVVDINDNFGNGTTTQSLSWSGNYTLDSPATGRGEATTTAGGSGFVSFNFYAVSNNQFLVLETDTNQIGTGMFQMQTAPSGAVAQSHVAMVHPAARPHAAWKRK
jgi:hypothetical protein